MHKSLYRILFVAMLTVASFAHAGMPAMPEVPTTLPDEVRQPLIDKRKPLAEKKLSLVAEADNNKKKCSNIVAGSEQHRTCLEMQKDFNARVEILRSEFEQLADEIDVAVDRNTIKNADPMVVDARNVPSGLPKSVDDAIPHTPSGERVRKGFQAIQDGDWKVALAWFKDALNKEPGNPGIARLVDLAQFTLDYRTRAQTPASGKNATPTQSPNQNASNQSAKAAETKPANGVERAAASQMAARARANAAFKKYVEKYGDHDAAGRAIAVSKAARGEGYTNEELKAQLQKALIDYRKDYRKNHPDGPDESVGGSSPTADEIITGGKQ